MSAGTKAEQSKNDETQVPSANAIGNTNVIGSQSPTVTQVIKIVHAMLTDNNNRLSQFEYMRLKQITIVSKTYLSMLKWFCLIGWCLAISIFLAILLL
jgi:hypothetical protein